MMLREAREHYYFYSGKVSDIVRQLGLGAIAVVWLFRSGETTAVQLPDALLLPLKLVIIGLAFDLLQYAFGAGAWGFFQWNLERSGASEADEFKAPSKINWPALACFWLKIAAISAAYGYLLTYLASVIGGS